MKFIRVIKNKKKNVVDINQPQLPFENISDKQNNTFNQENKNYKYKVILTKTTYKFDGCNDGTENMGYLISIKYPDIENESKETKNIIDLKELKNYIDSNFPLDKYTVFKFDIITVSDNNKIIIYLCRKNDNKLAKSYNKELILKIICNNLRRKYVIKRK